jgi:hypothetical protein
MCCNFCKKQNATKLLNHQEKKSLRLCALVAKIISRKVAKPRRKKSLCLCALVAKTKCRKIAKPPRKNRIFAPLRLSGKNKMPQSR